jgi:hypothetical protein
MYPPNDPRRALTAVEADPIFPLRRPQFIEFESTRPSNATSSGSLTWFVRSENLVIAFTKAKMGDAFDCSSEVDEVAVLLPGDQQSASLTSAATRRSSKSQAQLGPASFTVIPAGIASVRAAQDGIVVRIFAARSTGFAKRCINAETYPSVDPNVAEFAPWDDVCTSLEPVTYDYGAVQSSPARFGRIFRTDSSMVNVFYPESGPRDPSSLSPHSHADFDQVSLQLDGDYIHHVRAPWGPDSSEWQDDVHRRCSAPAIAIFPPPLIHTSQAVEDQDHQLVDIFGPPRADFAARDGWLLNASQSTNGRTDG